MDPTGIDSAEIFRELRRRVEERHRKLLELYPVEEINALQEAVDAVSRSWFVSAHNPITWQRPVIGRFAALAKRLVRLLLRWYINPIVDQQNNFNAAVARAIVELAAQQRQLAAELMESQGTVKGESG